MNIVLLALEQREEAANALVAAVALDDERALRVGELIPGDIEAHLALAPLPLEVRLVTAILRFGPRIDRALRQPPVDPVEQLAQQRRRQRGEGAARRPRAVAPAIPAASILSRRVHAAHKPRATESGKRQVPPA